MVGNVVSETAQHDPAEECAGVHCWEHGIDEVGTGYIRCFECGHLYRTAGQLRRAYRRATLSIPRYDVPRWRILWGALTVRAGRISFCQECIHDF